MVIFLYDEVTPPPKVAEKKTMKTEFIIKTHRTYKGNVPLQNIKVCNTLNTWEVVGVCQGICV